VRKLWHAARRAGHDWGLDQVGRLMRLAGIDGVRRGRRTDTELKSAGLAHLPSGHFMANAAWLALAVMAHNLGRAVGQLAGADLERATAATLRRKVFTMPGRLVHSGRRRHLRLPARWPWADAITRALASIHAIPLRC
jgi:hypothetical protein